MPVPSMFGVYASMSSGGGGGGGSAAFVTATGYAAAGAQAVSFTGAAAGDFALVAIFNADSSTLPAGWDLVGSYNWTDTGTFTLVASKVLSAGDIIAGSVTFTSSGNPAPVLSAFYSGVSAAAIVSQADAPATPVALPGFTKSGSCKAIVGISATTSTVAALTPPGTMVERIAKFNATLFSARLDDILTPSNYTNGSSLSWTCSGLPAEMDAALIELT